MTDIAFEIVILVLLLVLNGVFSMSEMAVVSARKTRLQQQADAGDRGAGRALDLAREPNRFLSTVQIGITLIGILAGAFGGATLAEQLGPALATVPALAPYSKALAVSIVVIIVTYLSLVIGELVPKRLALHSPERVAARVAGPMGLLSRLAAPLVSLLSASTDAVVRLLGLRPTEEPPVTEEEIRLLFEQGARAGVFAEAEQDLMEGVLRLGDQTVADLMTPRPRIVMLDVDAAPADTQRRMTETGYARYPVYQATPDNVLGVAMVKDLWPAAASGQPLDLRAVLQEPLFVPETMRVLKLVEAFKQSGQHLALVIDEYGGVQGLVTQTDVVRSLVRDLPVPYPVEARAIQRHDGSWLLDGMLSMGEVREIVPVGALPDEERGDYVTLGGFMMAALGRIPVSGDAFEANGLRFEVVDMDNNRVDKVLVQATKEDI